MREGYEFEKRKAMQGEEKDEEKEEEEEAVLEEERKMWKIEEGG
jgi:hypothetical protein